MAAQVFQLGQRIAPAFAINGFFHVGFGINHAKILLPIGKPLGNTQKAAGLAAAQAEQLGGEALPDGQPRQQQGLARLLVDAQAKLLAGVQQHMQQFGGALEFARHWRYGAGEQLAQVALLLGVAQQLFSLTGGGSFRFVVLPCVML